MTADVMTFLAGMVCGGILLWSGQTILTWLANQIVDFDHYIDKKIEKKLRGEKK